MSMEKKKIKDWGEKEMRDFLEKEGLKRLKKLFEETQNTDDDQENSDSSEENSKYDPTAIKNAENYFLDKKSKVLNDPIHGLMELHPLLIKIMDTPQFQRLRYIKQLGGAYFVYPGASHNRFEHSVGVAHLAGELARALRSKQPELKIDERDILCVQIAGLCHDLGHGPFSHLYDGIFIPKACRETKWKHEDASLRMFDHLVEDNGLKPLMELYGLKPEENDLEFIREMIQGKPLTEDQWRYKGRTEEKSFLYEIVANKLNGIDVDKFDYLARDAYHLGMQSNFDHKRFIMLARVCEVDGRNHICSRDKEVGNLYDMFHTRYCLHRRVCQHKTHKAIEIMISDAFLKADKHIEIEGSGPESCKLSTAKDDMVAYTKLTDQVFERILHPWSSSPDLEEARNILQRIVSRNLYMFVDETKIPQQKIDAWKAELAQDHANDENQAANAQVTSDQKETPKTSEQKMDKLKPELAQDHAKDENQADNVEITIVTFDYGKKEEDPINNTYFYSKDEKRGGFKISSKQKSKLLPASFSETIMRVYCKNAENVNLEGARKAFEDWCSKNGFAVPEDQDKAEEGK